MGEIEEASKAKITTDTAATFFVPPPGYWERWERLRGQEKAWLQTVPGQWWQAKQDERQEAGNALLKQLEGLGFWFDEEYGGFESREPDPDQIARCLECDTESIDECKACDLWPVIDGGSDGG